MPASGADCRRRPARRIGRNFVWFQRGDYGIYSRVLPRASSRRARCNARLQHSPSPAPTPPPPAIRATSKASSSTSPRPSPAGSTSSTVKRGDAVAVNARLYALEAVSETAAQRQAQEQVKAAEAHARRSARGQATSRAGRDARRSSRKRRSSSGRAATNLARDEAQFKIGGIARAQLDDARSAHAAAQARVAQLRSELTVAQLPSRNEQIQAQAAQVAAARAALEQATWKLDQKSVRATKAGRVLRHALSRRRMGGGRQPGRAHAAAANVKVRFFVPQTIVGALAPRTRGRDPMRRMRRRHSRHDDVRLERSRIHAAGHLQQRDAQQARVHGRGAAVAGERDASCIRASRCP